MVRGRRRLRPFLFTGEYVGDQVRAHSEGLQACNFGVAVNLGIFPAVAQVAFIGVEANQPAFPDQAESLGTLIVVFMDLGEAGGEGERRKEKGKSGGELGEVEFGEYLFHFTADIRIDAVIVVDMEKSSCQQVFPQVCSLFIREDHIAVAGHVDEREGEDIAAAGFYGDRIFFDGCFQVFVAEPDQVGEGSGVGVPVAAAVVLQESDPDGLGMQWAKERGKRKKEKGEEGNFY